MQTASAEFPAKTRPGNIPRPGFVPANMFSGDPVWATLEVGFVPANKSLPYGYCSFIGPRATAAS